METDTKTHDDSYHPFILAATCSLAVPVALFLVLWRRDTRRLAADNQASEARERDATSRLAAAEARLAAAEQALSAEKSCGSATKDRCRR